MSNSTNDQSYYSYGGSDNWDRPSDDEVIKEGPIPENLASLESSRVCGHDRRPTLAGPSSRVTIANPPRPTREEMNAHALRVVYPSGVVVSNPSEPHSQIVRPTTGSQYARTHASVLSSTRETAQRVTNAPTRRSTAIEIGRSRPPPHLPKVAGKGKALVDPNVALERVSIAHPFRSRSLTIDLPIENVAQFDHVRSHNRPNQTAPASIFAAQNSDTRPSQNNPPEASTDLSINFNVDPIDKDEEEVEDPLLKTAPQNPKNLFGLPSTVFPRELEGMRKLYEIPSYIDILLPEPFQRIYAPPRGYLGINTHCLENGFRVPMHRDIQNLLLQIGISPAQLLPNGMGLLVSLFLYLQSKGIRLTLKNFFATFSLAQIGGANGLYTVKQKADYKIFRSLTSSHGKDWKSRWVWLRAPRIDRRQSRWKIVDEWDCVISVPSSITSNLPLWVEDWENRAEDDRLYPYALLTQPLMYLAHHTSQPVYCASRFNLSMYILHHLLRIVLYPDFVDIDFALLIRSLVDSVRHGKSLFETVGKETKKRQLVSN